MRPPFLLPLLTIVTAAVVIVAYDVWLYLQGGAAATISWQLYLACKEDPIIPWLIGLIMGLIIGHLFWVQCAECPIPGPPK